MKMIAQLILLIFIGTAMLSASLYCFSNAFKIVMLLKKQQRELIGKIAIDAANQSIKTKSNEPDYVF